MAECFRFSLTFSSANTEEHRQEFKWRRKKKTNANQLFLSKQHTIHNSFFDGKQKKENNHWKCASADTPLKPAKHLKAILLHMLFYLRINFSRKWKFADDEQKKKWQRKNVEIYFVIRFLYIFSILYSVLMLQQK